MTTQPNSAPSFTEAPCSWNIRYTQGGFDCQLTLRGETGADVLTKAQTALTWLLANGAHPIGHTNGSKPQPEPQPAQAPVLDNGQQDPAWCPLHNCAMTRRERDGKAWYSHKHGEGYCKGK